MLLTRLLRPSLALLLICSALPVHAETGLQAIVRLAQSVVPASTTTTTEGQIEVGFSPGPGAQQVILKVIDSANETIEVLAYSFTSPEIANALVKAHRRGVKVRVVLDKSQRSEKYTSATFLANSGIPVRIDAQHAIQHQKTLVVDAKHVELGSANFTRSAFQRNAENAMVVWNTRQLAALFREDWESHWRHAVPYDARR